MGSSEAAFCGVLQGRRGDASRWARPRRPSAGFSNGGAARSAAVPFCPSLPRRPAVLLSLPSRPPSDAARARRGDASRWARPRRPSAGFCRAAETMLADGLVQGGFLRDFAGPPRRCFPLGSSEAAFHGIFQRRRCTQRRRSLLSFSPPPPGERMPRARSRPCEPAGSPYPFPHFPTARPYFFLYPAVLPTMPRAHAAAVLPEGLVQGGFPRGFAGPPRRCFPMGSSEAAFCGVLQGRRGDASRWARPRRPSAGFSNGGAARSAAVPFCPSLPRHRMPRVRSRPCEPAGSPYPFPHFPARPSHASSFTLPPGQRYRARSPKQCLPKGSSEAAFHGLLQGRRGDACRWARPRRASTGFCRATEAMLPDGLVQGGFLRGFAGPPRRCFPMGSSEAAFCGLFQCRRDDACRWARPRRAFTGFCRAAEAMLPVGLV